MTQQAYIPKEFQHSFMGFPKKYPYEGIERFERTQKRERQLKKRTKYKHQSRGQFQFVKQLEEQIKLGNSSDWRYDGEDEYEVYMFNHNWAARKVFELLKKKGLTRYL